jgi:outer membrane protein assembly factor BamB
MERGLVRAIDLAGGPERWRSTTPVDGATSSVAADGAIFVGTGDGKIESLDLATGIQRWRTTVSTDGQAAGAPAYADGLVFAGTTQGLVALRASSGDPRLAPRPGRRPVRLDRRRRRHRLRRARAELTVGRLRAVDARTGQPAVDRE